MKRLLGLALVAILGLHPPPSSAGTPPVGQTQAAEKIDTARSGVYQSGPWEFRFTITAQGTRSQGTTGVLLFAGQPVPEPSKGDYYRTPWGELHWQGTPPVMWGAHGWAPRPPDAKGGKLLPGPTVTAERPQVMGMVLGEGSGGPRAALEPWIKAELDKLGVKQVHVERAWFPLTDQAITLHDTKMYGTLTARLALPRGADSLEVLLDGSESARVALPRKDGSRLLVSRKLDQGLDAITFYLAFRVERASPGWPAPVEVGLEAAGKQIPLSGAREVVISLPGDKASGLVWTVKDVRGESPVRSSVKPVGQPQFVPALEGSGMPRAGTFENLFQVVNTGTSTVTLEYRRPWQTDVAPEKTFQVTLQVESLPPGL